MTYAELMAKLKRGEALTAEEMAEMEKQSRPAERFNEVSAKVQQLEAQLKDKDKEMETLQSQLTDESQRMQDEVQKQLAELSGKVETLAAERDTLIKERDSALRSVRVREIAQSNETGAVFSDPEYLGFLLDKAQVDVNDAEKVTEALMGFKENMPEMFKVDAKGGSGSGLGNQGAAQQQKTKPLKEWTDADKARFIEEGGKIEDYAVMIQQEGI